MKNSRFTKTQIIKILKEAEAGIAVEELRPQYGFSKSALYKWKTKYGGMETAALKRPSSQTPNRRGASTASGIQSSSDRLAPGAGEFGGWGRQDGLNNLKAFSPLRRYNFPGVAADINQGLQD